MNKSKLANHLKYKKAEALNLGFVYNAVTIKKVTYSYLYFRQYLKGPYLYTI